MEVDNCLLLLRKKRDEAPAKVLNGGAQRMRASAASSRCWLEVVPVNRSGGTCIVSGAW